jgi:hypothetical protein
VELPEKVYIIEFKFGEGKRIKNAQTLSAQALAQIDSRHYYEPYLGTGKKIILFGVGFLEKQLDGRVKVVSS